MLIVYYIYYLCVGQFQIMVNDAILIINYMLWIYTLGCLKNFHPSKISNTQNLNPGPASRSSSPVPPLRRCSLNFSRRRHLRAAPLLPPSLWLRRWTRARVETGPVGRGSICASPPAIFRLLWPDLTLRLVPWLSCAVQSSSTWSLRASLRDRAAVPPSPAIC